jgi:hypothetical protein
MNCTLDLVTRLYGSFSAERGISKNNPGKLIFMEER